MRGTPRVLAARREAEAISQGFSNQSTAATQKQSRSIAMKSGYVYIMNNRKNGTLYVGVTSDLVQRAYQHRNGAIEGCTKKYNLKKLVYFESHQEIADAIVREKQLKAGNRKKKITLIEQLNPDWNDLYPTIL